MVDYSLVKVKIILVGLESSLNLTHSWSGKIRWTYSFPGGISFKVDIMNSTRIRTRLAI